MFKDLETISGISLIVGTVTIVGGTVFGLIQLYELKKQRRDAVAVELMRAFMGSELADALTILRGLPDGASAEDLRHAGPETENAAVPGVAPNRTSLVLRRSRLPPHGREPFTGLQAVAAWHRA